MTVHTFETSAYIPEIEQSLLGALMCEGDARDVFALVTENHFIDPFHKSLYRAIKLARKQYGTANYTVIKKLIPVEDCDSFKKASGMEVIPYLSRVLSSGTCLPQHALPLAKSVVEQWARLAIANEAGRLCMAANDPQADVRVIASEAAKSFDTIMSEVRTGPVKNTWVSIGDAATKAIEAAAEAKLNGHGITGITWGLTDINRMTGGMQKRDLTLIGARPSMGKTSIALSVALKAAKMGHSCGFISLEMDNEKVAARALSDVAYDLGCKIPYVDLIRGKSSPEQEWGLSEAADKLASMDFTIDDKPGRTMSDIRTRAERMMEKGIARGKPLDALFIDHLGLIRSSDRYSGNRANEIAEMTAGAKALARDLNIAVVLLSQLNRGVEGRDDKRPQLSDLRDSGAIEQDADMIAFLYREAYYLERDKSGNEAERTERLIDCQNELEFIIAKQRNGPLGTVKLFADMAYSAVRNGVQR